MFSHLIPHGPPPSSRVRESVIPDAGASPYQATYYWKYRQISDSLSVQLMQFPLYSASLAMRMGSQTLPLGPSSWLSHLAPPK